MLILIFCWVVSLAAKVGNPYFYLQEGSEKCFSETLGQKTPLAITYSTDAHVAGAECQLTVRSTSGVVVALRSINPAEPKGTLAVVSKEPGTYWICCSCRNDHWVGGSSIKWSMHIDFLDSTISQPENAAKGSTMKSINANLSKAQNIIDRIVTFEDYQLSADRGMHQSINSLRRTIIGSNVFVTAVIAGGVVYSSRYLLQFLRREKVV